jgi:Family of unknown function (DUF5908)
MPIEIKELHIRISLNDQAKGKTNNSAPEDIKKSVQESMDQVVQYLKKQKER